MDEYENDDSPASADVRPFLEKADRYSAKLPNENFGAKQNQLEATTAKAVGLHLNLIKANLLQLLDAGLTRAQIFDCRVCTFCDQSFFSFRREKERAGRMLSFMMLKNI